MNYVPSPLSVLSTTSMHMESPTVPSPPPPSPASDCLDSQTTSVSVGRAATISTLDVHALSESLSGFQGNHSNSVAPHQTNSIALDEIAENSSLSETVTSICLSVSSVASGLQGASLPGSASPVSRSSNQSRERSQECEYIDDFVAL